MDAMGEMPDRAWDPGRAGDGGLHDSTAIVGTKRQTANLDRDPAPIQRLRSELDRVEQIALAGMFADADLGAQTYGMRPDDFTNPACVAVCRVVQDIEGKVRGPASFGEVDRHLAGWPAYDAAGGLRWLADCRENFEGDPPYWRDRLRETRVRLDLHDRLEAIADQVADISADPAAVLSHAEKALGQARDIIGTTHNGLDLIDAATLDDVDPPAREFVVDKLFARKTATLKTGEGGVGKSMLALQAAVCVCDGMPFLGRETVPGTALIYSCEDDQDELHRRLQRIRQSLGRVDNPPGRILLAPRVGCSNALIAFDGRTGLSEPTDAFRALEAAATVNRADLVVIDTTGQTFPGNENDRAAVTAYVNTMAGLAMCTNSCVLLLAHPPKNGGEYSGSTGWTGTVRARLFLRRQVGDDGITRYFIKLSKANYAPEFEDELVRDDNGVMWLANDLPPSMADRIDAYAGLAEAKRVFLAALDALTQQGRAVSHATRATNYAPKAIVAADLGQGCTLKQIAKAMEALFRDGVIEANAVVRKGSDRKPVYGIARTTPKGGAE